MFPGERYSRLRTLRSQRCLPAKKPLWRNLAAPLATDQAAHRLRTQRATPHRPAVAGGDCFPNVPPRTSEKSNTSKGSGRRRIMELVQRLMIRFGSAADMCSPRADVRAFESICRKPEKATCRGPRISLQRRPASSAARRCGASCSTSIRTCAVPDVVRLGPTDVDTFQGRDAFAIVTQKRMRPVWCPIRSELAAEMATWERRPGPFLLQRNGKPFTRKEFARQFAEARDAIPERKGLTLHGLRATAVINLRRAGLSYAQIGDIVGMSANMVEHYCATPTCGRTAAPR